MIEFKEGTIPDTHRRRYSEEDYERAEKWVEEKINPAEITGLDAGRNHIRRITAAPGIRKLTRRGRFDDILFEGFVQKSVSKSNPLRLVEDEKNWRERKKSQIARTWRTGRFLDELRAFQEPGKRSWLEKLLANRFERAVSTIKKDLQALRAGNFLKRLGSGKYVLTDEGERALRKWEW